MGAPGKCRGEAAATASQAATKAVVMVAPKLAGKAAGRLVAGRRRAAAGNAGVGRASAPALAWPLMHVWVIAVESWHTLWAFVEARLKVEVSWLYQQRRLPHLRCHQLDWKCCAVNRLLLKRLSQKASMQ